MTKNKLILQEHKDLIPLEKEYNNNIDLFINSSKDLIEGKVIYTTKNNLYLDFGNKITIKVSKELYIKNLIKIFLILNTSYLLTQRFNNKSILSRKKLKLWLKKKIEKGEGIRLKISNIEEKKNRYIIDFEKSINYIKYIKLFSQLNEIKENKKSIKGFITNTVKGGFSVAIGGLIAFLPDHELMKTSNDQLSKTFINSSMNFKISKINFKNKNIILNKE